MLKNKNVGQKEQIFACVPFLRDENGNDEFDSKSRNFYSACFKNAVGNAPEFIARII